MGFRVLAAALAALSLSLAARPALADCSIGAMAELPVTMSGLRPLVPAKINGAEVMFVADSGAFYSTITPSAADRLNLRLAPAPFNISISGVGGLAKTYVTTVRTFTLAHQNIPDVDFFVTESGGGAAGLIGQNVLGIADVEYDLGNGVIRLMKPEGCDGHAMLAYWAGGKPLSTIDILPKDEARWHTIGAITVNGVRLRAAFDTGAAVSMITLNAARRAGVTPSDPGVRPGGLNSGIGPHPVRTWIARFASVRIGGEEIRNGNLRIADADLNDFDMLIGADFFLSHHVYVANSQRKLYFTYNGGPVFNLNEQTQVQDAPNAAPKPSADTGDELAEPTDAEGYARRGAAFDARHDHDKAIADFTKAIALAPAEPRYLDQRAQALLAAGKTDAALADLEAALKLKPDDVAGRLARAQIRLQRKDEAGAVQDLDAGAAAAAKDSDQRYALAVMYLGAHRPDAAVAQLDLWIDAHADSGELAEMLNLRCWASALDGHDLDKALDDCNRALRLGPKTPGFLDSRGLVRLRRGEYDKAIADYDMALAARPHEAWSLYGRGLAELRSNRKVDGQADVAAALALRPRLADEAKRYGIVGSDGN
jgi:tetratricopeptide (TPR) repeat protein